MPVFFSNLILAWPDYWLLIDPFSHPLAWADGLTFNWSLLLLTSACAARPRYVASSLRGLFYVYVRFFNSLHLKDSVRLPLGLRVFDDDASAVLLYPPCMNPMTTHIRHAGWAYPKFPTGLLVQRPIYSNKPHACIVQYQYIYVMERHFLKKREHVGQCPDQAISSTPLHAVGITLKICISYSITN